MAALRGAAFAVAVGSPRQPFAYLTSPLGVRRSLPLHVAHGEAQKHARTLQRLFDEGELVGGLLGRAPVMLIGFIHFHWFMILALWMCGARLMPNPPTMQGGCQPPDLRLPPLVCRVPAARLHSHVIPPHSRARSGRQSGIVMPTRFG